MNDGHHDAFDRRMRALHGRAVEQLPSRTLYELRVRRANAASAAPAHPARRTGGWWLAAGFAAMFALAIGLRQPGSPLPAGDAAAPAAVAQALAPATIDATTYDDGVIAALEEDPDLYLWLASQDNLILAME